MFKYTASELPICRSEIKRISDFLKSGNITDHTSSNTKLLQNLYIHCTPQKLLIFCSICSLNFGRRHVLLVHMMTVHKLESDQAENLIKEQLKDINMGSRDVVYRYRWIYYYDARHINRRASNHCQHKFLPSPWSGTWDTWLHLTAFGRTGVGRANVIVPICWLL